MIRLAHPVAHVDGGIERRGDVARAGDAGGEQLARRIGITTRSASGPEISSYLQRA